MRNFCNATGCHRDRDERMKDALMCRKHWYRVPGPMKAKLRAARELQMSAGTVEARQAFVRCLADVKVYLRDNEPGLRA